MDEQEQCVRQVTITFPYFRYEVPILYMGNGTLYLLVISLCEMFGLRMFCGRWTSCYSTRKTEISLYLLPQRFLSSLGHRNILPFEVDTYIIP